MTSPPDLSSFDETDLRAEDLRAALGSMEWAVNWNMTPGPFRLCGWDVEGCGMIVSAVHEYNAAHRYRLRTPSGDIPLGWEPMTEDEWATKERQDWEPGLAYRHDARRCARVRELALLHQENDQILRGLMKALGWDDISPDVSCHDEPLAGILATQGRLLQAMYGRCSCGPRWKTWLDLPNPRWAITCSCLRSFRVSWSPSISRWSAA